MIGEHQDTYDRADLSQHFAELCMNHLLVEVNWVEPQREPGINRSGVDL